MICEINAKEHRRALKKFREQQERVARDALELKLNESYFKGEEKGILLGKNEANLTTARRLKERGATSEFIMEITGLDEEKIKLL